MSNLKQSIGALGGKINSACRYVKTYLSKAPKNRYLSFKEAAAYCIGGIGINAASTVQTFLTLTYGMYVAAALNLSNDMIMSVGTTVFSLGPTVINALFPLLANLIFTVKGGGDKLVVGWSMFILSFLLTLFNSVQVVTNYAITAQQYEDQQFRTGERMKGFCLSSALSSTLWQA